MYTHRTTYCGSSSGSGRPGSAASRAGRGAAAAAAVCYSMIIYIYIHIHYIIVKKFAYIFLKYYLFPRKLVISFGKR